MAVEVSLMALAGGIARRVRPRLLGAAALPLAACALAGCGGSLPCEAAALKTVLRDNELKSDLAHPNTRGYAKLAVAVAALLKKSGAL
jgi:lysophospholipase L1-like esterase